MTFISYAQNFEDVMLWRALRHVECGFYIDVGAWSPDVDSVTRAFYERGWRGINIEPNPKFHALLMEKRPRDLNLKIAISDSPGTLWMNFLSNPGLSTLDDRIARQHEQAGWENDRQEVQITTLAAIWDSYISPGQDVHFLKVDVEGFEERVLRSNEWKSKRPWIVLVEATLPISQVESFSAWEPILLAADYQFAYADGLNRYYVAQEHSELLEKFKYPPNVFDDFQLVWHQEAESKAQQAEVRAQQAEVRAQQAEVRAQQAEVRAQQAEVRAQQAEVRAQQAETKAQQAEAAAKEILLQLNAVYASTSWRVTAPLRAISRGVHSLTLAPRAIKSSIKQGLRSCAAQVARRPRLKRLALVILNRMPTLKARLMQMAGDYRNAFSSSTHQPAIPLELHQLSPRARQIYADLKSALAKRQEEK